MKKECIPFINSYLEEHKDDNEIKEMLDNNICKTIAYSQIGKKTNLEDYDYIIIVGKSELKDVVKNKLYIKYKKKLFFVGNYNNLYFDKIYKNIIREIKTGLNIELKKVNKRRILLSNLIQNISLTNVDCNNDIFFVCNYKRYFILKYGPSSVKQIDIKFRDSTHYLSNNMTNNIKIISINCFGYKKLKLPNKVVLLIGIEKTRIFDRFFKSCKNILKIKTKVSFVDVIRKFVLCENKNHGGILHKMIIKKNNKGLLVKINEQKCQCIKRNENITHFCKKNIIIENNSKNIWKIISGYSLNKEYFYWNDHYVESLNKSINISNYICDEKTIEFAKNNRYIFLF